MSTPSAVSCNPSRSNQWVSRRGSAPRARRTPISLTSLPDHVRHHPIHPDQGEQHRRDRKAGHQQRQSPRQCSHFGELPAKRADDGQGHERVRGPELASQRLDGSGRCACRLNEDRHSPDRNAGHRKERLGLERRAGSIMADVRDHPDHRGDVAPRGWAVRKEATDRILARPELSCRGLSDDGREPCPGTVLRTEFASSDQPGANQPQCTRGDAPVPHAAGGSPCGRDNPIRKCGNVLVATK